MSRASQPAHAFRIYADLALTPSAKQLLEEGTAGHELLLAGTPGASMLVGAADHAPIEQSHVLFGQPDPAVISRSPHLRWIQISSSGITRYDTPEFRAQISQRGIALCNSADVFAQSCAAHVMSFMLAHTRRLPAALRSHLAHGDPAWHELRNSCVPLAGQSILILGFGAIGERLSEMLAPFRAKVAAYRRRVRGVEKVPVVTSDGLPAALAQADHIVDILPDSPETRNFLDAVRFSQVKPGAIFYNIGRGATVDQAALLAALDSGRIASAWLDVTEPEPLPSGHPLLTHPRCFITPHIAGGHADEVGHLVRHFLENFQRFQNGQPVRDRVM